MVAAITAVVFTLKHIVLGITISISFPIINTDCRVGGGSGCGSGSGCSSIIFANTELKISNNQILFFAILVPGTLKERVLNIQITVSNSTLNDESYVGGFAVIVPIRSVRFAAITTTTLSDG